MTPYGQFPDNSSCSLPSCCMKNFKVTILDDHKFLQTDSVIVQMSKIHHGIGEFVKETVKLDPNLD